MGKLDNLNQQVRHCRLCRLCRLRENGVPGEGNESAEVMFIGEGPGFNEDREGRPFVGAAGQFLDELLGLAGLARRDVYITNVVKCRPPQNRDPLPDEIDACAPYLERQIATINPVLIVTLGRFSMARFFPDDKISSVHGKAREIEGRVVMTMWHPAFGLRSPEGKESIKDDFRTLPGVLERARALRNRRPEAAPAPPPDLAALVARHLDAVAPPAPVAPPVAALPPTEPEDGFAYLEAVTSRFPRPAGRRKRAAAAAEVVSVTVPAGALHPAPPEAAPAAPALVDEAPAPAYVAEVAADVPPAGPPPIDAAAPVPAPPAKRTRRPKAEAVASAEAAPLAPDASAERGASAPDTAPAPAAKPPKKGKGEPDFTQLSLFE